MMLIFRLSCWRLRKNEYITTARKAQMVAGNQHLLAPHFALPPHFEYQLDAETIGAWRTMATTCAEKKAFEKPATESPVPTSTSNLEWIAPRPPLPGSAASPCRAPSPRETKGQDDDLSKHATTYNNKQNGSAAAVVASTDCIVPTKNDVILGGTLPQVSSSLFRALIQKHWQAYFQLPNNYHQLSERRPFIQQHIITIIQEHGGRFLVRKKDSGSNSNKNNRAFSYVELFPERPSDQRIIYCKIQKALSQAKLKATTAATEPRALQKNQKLFPNAKGAGKTWDKNIRINDGLIHPEVVVIKKDKKKDGSNAKIIVPTKDDVILDGRGDTKSNMKGAWSGQRRTLFQTLLRIHCETFSKLSSISVKTAFIKDNFITVITQNHGGRFLIHNGRRYVELVLNDGNDMRRILNKIEKALQEEHQQEGSSLGWREPPFDPETIDIHAANRYTEEEEEKALQASTHTCCTGPILFDENTNSSNYNMIMDQGTLEWFDQYFCTTST
jgi:uncharacterized protein (DUF1330 family)